MSNVILFVLAWLFVGLFIAAWALGAYVFDEEFRREIDVESGIELIPYGHSLFAVAVLIVSPLFPAAALCALIRWAMGCKESEK